MRGKCGFVSPNETEIQKFGRNFVGFLVLIGIFDAKRWYGAALVPLKSDCGWQQVMCEQNWY